MGLTDLPDELILHILSFLPKDELLHLRLINLRFYWMLLTNIHKEHIKKNISLYELFEYSTPLSIEIMYLYLNHSMKKCDIIKLKKQYNYEICTYFDNFEINYPIYTILRYYNDVLCNIPLGVFLSDLFSGGSLYFRMLKEPKYKWLFQHFNKIIFKKSSLIKLNILIFEYEYQYLHIIPYVERLNRKYNITLDKICDNIICLPMRSYPSTSFTHKIYKHYILNNINPSNFCTYLSECNHDTRYMQDFENLLYINTNHINCFEVFNTIIMKHCDWNIKLFTQRFKIEIMYNYEYNINIIRQLDENLYHKIRVNELSIKTEDDRKLISELTEKGKIIKPNKSYTDKKLPFLIKYKYILSDDYNRKQITNRNWAITLHNNPHFFNDEHFRKNRSLTSIYAIYMKFITMRFIFTPKLLENFILYSHNNKRLTYNQLNYKNTLEIYNNIVKFREMLLKHGFNIHLSLNSNRIISLHNTYNMSIIPVLNILNVDEISPIVILINEKFYQHFRTYFISNGYILKLKELDYFYQINYNKY